MAATNLVTKLSAIGDAIRSKTGTTELLTLDDMPTAIEGIETGDGSLPDEALTFSGDLTFAFRPNWNWFVEEYGDQISTEDITTPSCMFGFDPRGYAYTQSNTSLESVPFALSMKEGQEHNAYAMFAGCSNLRETGAIRNLKPTNTSFMFGFCHNLRYLPEFENLDMGYMQENGMNAGTMFIECYSLRKIPESFLLFPNSSGGGALCNSNVLASLDDISRINPESGTRTGNMFDSWFTTGLFRVKDITFKTQEDGSPFAAQWKSQNIVLSSSVGYIDASSWGDSAKDYIIGYNSGITEDKEVFGSTSYANLKDDPDWFTCNVSYSRYNHDSAVATLNSLPDCSAYLAENGGINNIKFLGESGALTDGGAINTLTEEEIAVATAKGWTVSFV